MYPPHLLYVQYMHDKFEKKLTYIVSSNNPHFAAVRGWVKVKTSHGEDR